MSARGVRHPVVVAWCCRLYGLMLWMYPASLRCEYRHEMLLTFRNAAEDAINDGSVSSVARFAMHTATDWLRTLLLEREEEAASVLGLGSSEGVPAGCLDSSTVSVSLMLATLGMVLLVAGWCEWLHLRAVILAYHRAV
jgi:hypothetical protein